MARYEYKVIPAPARGRKAPGIKGAEARFAHGLETAMNELAAQGWEYLRADILPSEERQGLASTQTVYRSVLVFRRGAEAESAAPAAEPPLTAPGASDMADPAAPAAGADSASDQEAAQETGAPPLEPEHAPPHLQEAVEQTYGRQDDTGPDARDPAVDERTDGRRD
ncbi:DUF4177 domain-containing protein [Roseovarius salis]|uniref:DUF4177 domain-containing protein n=1 Tax=Roseovarius salis TaxID=3376063 RepID=UPI0037C53E55